MTQQQITIDDVNNSYVVITSPTGYTYLDDDDYILLEFFPITRIVGATLTFGGMTQSVTVFGNSGNSVLFPLKNKKQIIGVGNAATLTISVKYIPSRVPLIPTNAVSTTVVNTALTVVAGRTLPDRGHSTDTVAVTVSDVGVSQTAIMPSHVVSMGGGFMFNDTALPQPQAVTSTLVEGIKIIATEQGSNKPFVAVDTPVVKIMGVYTRMTYWVVFDEASNSPIPDPTTDAYTVGVSEADLSAPVTVYDENGEAKGRIWAAVTVVNGFGGVNAPTARTVRMMQKCADGERTLAVRYTSTDGVTRYEAGKVVAMQNNAEKVVYRKVNGSVPPNVGGYISAVGRLITLAFAGVDIGEHFTDIMFVPDVEIYTSQGWVPAVLTDTEVTAAAKTNDYSLTFILMQ